MAEKFYTKYAGQTQIEGAGKDRFGNADGEQYDLAKPKAFKGQTIAVMHLYTGGDFGGWQDDFDFKLPEQALKEKGFEVYRWTQVPSLQEFRRILDFSCQFWLIPTAECCLSDEHIRIIKNFFDSGKGIYLWGDNWPYYADTNILASIMFGVTMSGSVPGGNILTIRRREGSPGLIPHLVTTGIEYLFEGVTIATLQRSQTLMPLVYGSANNLLIATFDDGKRRAIIDGGFTRLYINWDTAGTGRYVKNAAAWLANVEHRFTDTSRAVHQQVRVLDALSEQDVAVSQSRRTLDTKAEVRDHVFCSNCGTSNKATAKYCIQCGERI